MKKIILIVFAVLLVAGAAVFCVLRFRTQKNQESFAGLNEDLSYAVQKNESSVNWLSLDSVETVKEFASAYGVHAEDRGGEYFEVSDVPMFGKYAAVNYYYAGDGVTRISAKIRDFSAEKLTGDVVKRFTDEVRGSFVDMMGCEDFPFYYYRALGEGYDLEADAANDYDNVAAGNAALQYPMRDLSGELWILTVQNENAGGFGGEESPLVAILERYLQDDFRDMDVIMDLRNPQPDA